MRCLYSVRRALVIFVTGVCKVGTSTSTSTFYEVQKVSSRLDVRVVKFAVPLLYVKYVQVQYGRAGPTDD